MKIFLCKIILIIKIKIQLKISNNYRKVQIVTVKRMRNK